MLQTNRIKSRLSDGDGPCFNLHTTNETDLIVQRNHGIIDIYNKNESNWILNKSVDYKYRSFCRYINRNVTNLSLKVILRFGVIGLSYCLRRMQYWSHLIPQE